MTKDAELTEELVKMKKAEEESKVGSSTCTSLKLSCITKYVLVAFQKLELQARGGRIRELEEELRVVKAELQQEKEEKVDLVTEKVREVGG